MNTGPHLYRNSNSQISNTLLMLTFDDIPVFYGIADSINNFLERILDLGAGLLQGSLIHVSADVTDSLAVFVINGTGADYAWNIFSIFVFSPGFTIPAGIAS